MVGNMLYSFILTYCFEFKHWKRPFRMESVEALEKQVEPCFMLLLLLHGLSIDEVSKAEFAMFDR